MAYTIHTNTSETIAREELLCFYDALSIDRKRIIIRHLMCILGSIQFGIQLIGFPALQLLGTIGQILTIVVLLKLKHWKATCRIYYLTIAFADLILLMNFPLWNWLYFLQALINNDNNGFLFPSASNLTCKIYLVWKYISWFVSCYTLVFYALERLIVISYPFSHGCIATTKAAIIICVTLPIVAIFLHVPLAFTDIYVVTDNDMYAPRTCKMIMIKSLILEISTWIVLCLTIFLPPYLLCILNLLLLIKL